MDDLALQVGFLDDVELDDAQRADTGGGQIEQHRRTQSPRPDDQHAGVLEAPLPVAADARKDQVPAVAGNLVAGEFSCRGHQWRQGHAIHCRLPAERACRYADTPRRARTLRTLGGTGGTGGRTRQAIGYGQGLNRQVFPSGLTDSGSNRAASLSEVEKVCCIMIGASAPSRSHGSCVT